MGVLAEKFSRKGGFGGKYNNIRLFINHTQIKASGDGVYMYEVEYDKDITYWIFICDYYEHDGQAHEMFPGDKSYENGRAFNTRSKREANHIYNELKKENKKLMVELDKQAMSSILVV